MVQMFQEQPRRNYKAEAMGALGQGLGQGISDIVHMTLQQKMSVLEDQRKQDFAMKQRETMAEEAEGHGFHDIGQLFRIGFGPEHISKIASEFPQILTPTTKSKRGMPALESLTPKRQDFGTENQLIPMQDREAEEEPQVSRGQRMQVQHPQVPPQEQQEMLYNQQMREQPRQNIPKQETESAGQLKTLDDYRRKLAPNYDDLGKTAKQQVDRSAEREFNADYKIKGNIRDEQKMALSETKDYRKTMAHMGDNARKELAASKYMDKLIDSKKLDSPLAVKAAEILDFPGLLSPESNAFQKSLGEFLPGMKDVYGSRVTNQDQSVFLSTLPNLRQTDEGKKITNALLRKRVEAKIIKADAYNEIMKEHKGIPPIDLPQQVEERSRKALDKNYQDMINLSIKGTSDTSGFKKVKQGTKIPPNVAEDILNTYKDPDVAQKVAEQLGYDVG